MEPKYALLAGFRQRFRWKHGGTVKEIRLEARLRNNILWHLIFDSCESVAQFCRKHGLSNQEVVGGLLNLKASPVNADGKYRKVCQRLAEIAKVIVEDLFPLHLYRLPETKMAKEFGLRELAAGRQREMLLIPAETTPHEVVVSRELAEQVDRLLGTLTPHEEKVMRWLFGLSPHGEQTYEEVGEEFEVTRERIRQIEVRALRKLRHPSRSSRLKPFVEE